MPKHTIFNDPIYGFIPIEDGIIFDLVEHPWFQRLRRIKQLSLTHLVYSGAHHTRFHHAIGAMHLMNQAIEVLKSKGHSITKKEEEGVCIAILLHDIGHGPYSHTLEHSIVHGVSHEDLSALFMDRLNKEFKGKLTTAIEIFKNKYPKKFLHQLVSSQLDMDRLDYLRRDSFFSGVSEGVVSTDRIIKMLNVANDQLAIDAKGIYSIEKFIIARRLMYWQVYLHKTVLSAEFLLMKILLRAKELSKAGELLFATEPFQVFLQNRFTKKDFHKSPELLNTFAELDDYDIMGSVKEWSKHPDMVLSTLSDNLVKRKLFKVEITNKPITKAKLIATKKSIAKRLKLSKEEVQYFVFPEEITNSAYNPKKDKINIRYKSGEIKDIAQAADLLNISVLSEAVKKHFLFLPKI